MRKLLILSLGVFFATHIFTGCSKSTTLSKNEISALLNKVADRQMANFKYSTKGSAGFLHDHGIDAWTNAVLYIGLSDWAKTSDNKSYYKWLYNIGETNFWDMPENFAKNKRYGLYHADELCIGQFYLEMFDVYKEEKIITSALSRMKYIMENPPGIIGDSSGLGAAQDETLNLYDVEMSAKNKRRWTWCDALFMAPPLYTHMSSLQNDNSYIDYMHKEFMDTYNHLFDNDNGLFFRDDSYFEKQENNGQKIFWGRGNGWVVAGVARILKYMPANYPDRPFYENLLIKHIDRLLELRDENGFWRASLLDPKGYPSPEASATALITYAMAYGVNSGILDKRQYMPHIEKSWQALISVVDKNGKLGFVQPIGADPRKVTKDMTAVYGVGAFLMAGSEIFQFAK